MTAIDINAMFADGGDVILPPGVFESPAFVIPPRRILGLHPDTLLQPDASVTSGVFGTMNDGSWVDGSGQIMVPLATLPSVSVLRADGKTNPNVRGVRFPSAGQFAVIFANCQKPRVENILVSEANQMGVFFSFCSGGRVRDSQVEKTLISHGFQFADGADNEIIGSGASGTVNFGISVYREQYSKVIGNHTHDTKIEGINVSDSQQCQVGNNSVTWYGSPTFVSVDFGISVAGDRASGARCDYTQIYNNSVYGCAKSGIALAGNVSNTIVAANSITDVNRWNEPQGAAILAYDVAAQFNMIVNNLARGNSNMKFGFNDTTGGAITNKYANNDFIWVGAKYARTSAAW